MDENETENTVPDLLYGMSKIADYMGVKRSVAYHLAATQRIPVFRIGRTVCARRSTVSAALEQMEAASTDSDR